MNAALILTGHLRCWDRVFPNTKQAILDKYNPDVFIHAWDNQAWWDPHSKEGFVADSPKIDQSAVIDAYKPVGVFFEDFETKREYFEKAAENYSNHYHVKRNILSMFYKIGRGVDMMNEYTSRTGKHYDIVIRMRPDLVFKQWLPELNASKFYTLLHRNHVGMGTGDSFQASNQWLMTMFGNISILLPNLYKNTGILCPHIISENMFKTFGMQWEEISISTVLMHTPAGPYRHKNTYLTNKST